jgi:hypothetical protein
MATRSSYRKKRDVRLVPNYLIAETFGVCPHTVSRYATKFGYNPYDATSFIRFIRYLQKTLDNPIA